MELKRGQLTYAILSILGTVGMIAVAITAPNLFKVFSSYRSFPKTRNWNIKRSLRTMQIRGAVKIQREGIIITKVGREELLKYSLNEIVLKQKNDGQLRMVVFDVPVSQNKSRKMFTYKLKELGFKYLQKSIWVINRPCRDEIKHLAKLLHIEANVRIITVSKIE